jgi:hypothetical protein
MNRMIKNLISTTAVLLLATCGASQEVELRHDASASGLAQAAETTRERDSNPDTAAGKAKAHTTKAADPITALRADLKAVAESAETRVDGPGAAGESRQTALLRVEQPRKASSGSKVPSAPCAAVPRDAASSPGVQSVLDEVRALRVEVRRLQETLDRYLEVRAADLARENDVLRREVADLYSLLPEEELGVLRTPRPGRDIIEDALAQVQQAPPVETAPDPGGKQPVAAHGGAYTIVREWGRTPEEAAAFGAGVSSLKGMVCAVARGMQDADLAALGQTLRDEFEEYDNINIEVFDDVEAAQRYAGENIASPEHKVLTVTKHLSSGLDTIIVFRGGATMPVPVDE